MRGGDALRSAIREAISGEVAFQIDYVSIADPDSLEELQQVGASALASLAARIGRTRLIDNLLFGAETAGT